jgi:hypothetical protein
MGKVTFRIADDVKDEFDRGRKAQGFRTADDYFTALVLSGGKRKSGLYETVWESAAADARVGGAVSGAIAAINKDDAPEAIRLLRFAQDVIMEALVAKRETIIDATAERIRVKLGSDDWEQAERR